LDSRRAAVAIVIEILFQFLVEFVIPILVEILAELGIRSTSQALGYEKPKNPYLAAFGYLLLAGAGAGISLYVFPAHQIKHPEWRLINLLVTPVLIGGLMALRGKILLRKRRVLIRLDSFLYGYLFALTFTFVRFYFGK
jgi:hypothetical protein